MTSAEKTRKRNIEAQREKERKRKEVRRKMIDGCLHVLDDPGATSRDRMKAIEILHDIDKGR